MCRSNAHCCLLGKITSLDTSTMRAAMKPGWEDLVRRCIQKFHTQHEGESVSYAKRHHHEGNGLSVTPFLKSILLTYPFWGALSLQQWFLNPPWGLRSGDSCPGLLPSEGKWNRRNCRAKSVMREVKLKMITSHKGRWKGTRSFSSILRLLDM